MKYRQWKKNYKKRYGVNPPASIDKRKQRKAAKRAFKHLAETITYTDFSEAISKAANTFTDAVASIMRAMGSICDGAGTAFKNVADGIQPLEIRGNALSWEVKPVVCGYGVYENNALDGSSELKLITNSRRAAEKIAEIMQQDHLEHIRLNYPERIQKRQDTTDGLTAALALYDEGAFADA
nr:MAG TPA: hypothetical protein [Caudoviricetes sp.]